MRTRLRACISFCPCIAFVCIRCIIYYMRTSLILPSLLLDEARTALGFQSKTDTVVYALREVVRRTRADELKALVGQVRFEFDSAELRKKDRRRV